MCNYYVEGRTIFDTVRTIEDVMEFSGRYNLEGRMICILDFKAFDTVTRDFLFHNLMSFGLMVHHFCNGFIRFTTLSQVVS